MIHIENVYKLYRMRNGTIKALDEINMHVHEGEFVVVRGPSGCGKSTLLLTMGGMLCPTQGKVTIGDRDFYSMNVKKRAAFRADNIGFVFQMFHLVPYLNVLENVLLAAKDGISPDIRTRAANLLERLRMADRQIHTPAELSTGERQRTAIARALLNHPKVILADEPTGNLDPDNAAEAIGYLSEFHREGGTVVVVTHGADVDVFANRIVHLHDGRIKKSTENNSPPNIP